MPIDELWTIAGPTQHVRLRALSPEDVDGLLNTFPDLRFVEARISHELRWYPRGHYDFWWNRARKHAAQPENGLSLDEFPDSMCYFVSEWLPEESQDRVLLFEQYH